jgi:[ribosomal protein S18]-alanine N-acetyltransferase
VIERLQHPSAEELAALGALVTLGASGFDVKTELSRSYAGIWVARADTEIAGFLLAWDVADEVHLLDVVVAVNARRRGHGRALLQALLEHARTRRARLVLLEVRKSNQAARELYEKLGFSRCGERLRYYSDGEDAVLMQVEVPS